MNNLESLKKWAEKVINIYTPLAEELDVDYYPLQSEIKLNSTKFLIIGLNPGGGFSYNQQKENKLWEFNNGRMTTERLLKGNPTYEKNKDTWPIIRGLKRLSSLKEIIENESYCYINYFYFSTNNFKKVLNNADYTDIVKISKELTYDFIRIVNPQVIFILGTANGIDLLDFQDKITILNGIKNRLLISAYFDSIPVLAIPHPSRLTLSYEENVALNTNLKEFLSKKELTRFSFGNTKINRAFNIDLLNEKLSNYKILFTKNGNDKYDCILDGIENDKLLIRIVVKPKEKYWGLRSALKIEGDWINHLKGKELYKKIVSTPFNENANSWLITKKIIDYDFENDDHSLELLASEFKKFYFKN